MYEVTTTKEFRVLLQTARKSRGMTQREAAEIAGIDESWWKKLESGRRDRARSGTIASMAYAAGLAPEDLDGLDMSDSANRLRILLTQDTIPDLSLEAAEEHLAMTPGTTAGEREELIIRLRDIRRRRLDRHRRDEPFDEEFTRATRRRF